MPGSPSKQQAVHLGSFWGSTFGQDVSTRTRPRRPPAASCRPTSCCARLASKADLADAVHRLEQSNIAAQFLIDDDRTAHATTGSGRATGVICKGVRLRRRPIGGWNGFVAGQSGAQCRRGGWLGGSPLCRRTWRRGRSTLH